MAHSSKVLFDKDDFVPEFTVKVVGNAEAVFEKKVVLVRIISERVLPLLVDAGPITLHEAFPNLL